MQVIPAIDILDGKVVRLKQGNFNNVTAFECDPLTYAKQFEQQGAKQLHLVDLSGSRDGKLNLLSIIQQITSKTSLAVQVGGGIRSVEDAEKIINAGASKIVLGTILCKDLIESKKLVQKISTKKCIAALDVYRDEVKISGWEEGSGFSIFEACERVVDLGIRDVLITAIECDGMQQGPNVDLYEKVSLRFPDLCIIASGGIRNRSDVELASSTGCEACVIGKALLTGEVDYRQLSSCSDLCVRIIPCLDIKDGRTVKGTSFQNLRDAGDPVELAKEYCKQGADELVFLDITATYEDRSTVYNLVSSIAEVVNIPFTIGGGVRSVDDAEKLLQAGADKVAINSAAVKNPQLLSDVSGMLGSANTVCAIDAKKKGDSWTVLTRGGRDDSGIDAIKWAIEAVERGAGELLVTSFDNDGTGDGFDTDLLAAIKKEVRVPVIASGGAGTLQSFKDAIKLGNADALLAASVFHFGTLSVKQVKQFLSTSYSVRL